MSSPRPSSRLPALLPQRRPTSVVVRLSSFISPRRAAPTPRRHDADVGAVAYDGADDDAGVARPLPPSAPPHRYNGYDGYNGGNTPGLLLPDWVGCMCLCSLV